MLKIECQIETQKSKYLLQVAEDKPQKSNACLMKIRNINEGKTIGEKIEGVNGKITRGTLKIEGQAKITVKKNRKRSIILISITPQ